MLLANPAALVNIASGVLMAALGLGLYLANPRKDWNRVFALLAVFWGIQIAGANGVRITDDPATARLAGTLGLAFLIPLYFFAANFASIFPRPRGAMAESGLSVALLALPAAAALLALFAAPETLVADVLPAADGSFTLRWGPLLPYLVTAPFFGAFFYALFTMMRRLDEAESAIERRQITFVLAALALFVAHVIPGYLAAFLGSYLGGSPEAAPGEAALFALIFLAGLGLLALLTARILARVRAGGPAAGERVVLAAIGAGAGSAALFIALAAAGGPDVEAIGVVRAGSVALIVYAIARYQLFDIDLRVKSLGAAATALLVAGVLAAAAWLALREARLPDALGVTVAGLAALAAFVPVLRASYRVADRLAPGVSREGDHLYLRKLEVYRASVEAALREGRAPREDDPALAELRGKLGLSQRDHGVVVSLAATRAEPARAAPDLRPGGAAFGKYAIDSLLAEGGFGRVFLARDRVLNRPVVIKELLAQWRGNPAVVRTFLREAQIAGQLQHPNIVAVYEVEQHGADHYVVMEYVPGGTLAERLRGGALPPAEAARVARGVLEALDAAHARGVVHRDVKPENVLLGARGEVKLADFGIAQLGEEEPQRTISGLTAHGVATAAGVGTSPGLATGAGSGAGAILAGAGASALGTRAPGGRAPGTVQYMSPEQARGEAVDPRSDLYAVGALLHRMLTGRHHVEVRNLDELAARSAVAAARAPEPPQGLQPALAAVVVRALQPDPAQRFPGARAFADALAAVSTQPGPQRP